jgi:adenosylcobinamide kinase / adenosylcobinamide-phosphate guanylyltransferase
MGQLTFIIGGARSGKSDHAERLAVLSEGDVLYIATAQALDEEMRQRIEAHQEKRSARWRTIELPTDVGTQLLARPPHADVLIVDCLTLLVSNALLKAAPDPDQPDEAGARLVVESEINSLLKAVAEIPGQWLIVSNEVGQGVVPAYAAGRLFRDLLGWANQRLADKADEVIWMVAGIPIPIGQHRLKE